MSMTQTQAPENRIAGATNQGIGCDHAAYQRHLSCRACLVCHLGVLAPAPMALMVPAVVHFPGHTISSDSSFPGWMPFRIERPPRLWS